MGREIEEQMNEWYAGLQLEGRRDLRPAELASVRNQARRCVCQVVGLIVGAVFAVWLFSLIVEEADLRSATESRGIASTAVVLGVVGLPVSLILLRDCFTRARGLYDDLKTGYVKQFAGPSNFEGEDILARLRRATSLAPPDPDTTLHVEVLPASGRVWFYNGRYVQPWITAKSAEVALTPPIAAIAANWLEPVSKTGSGKVLANRRELSAPELTELRRHVTQLWLRPLPVALGLTVWLCMPVWVLAVHGHIDRSDFWLGFWRLLFLALAADIYFGYRAWQALRLRRDLEAGVVLILRFQTDGGDGEAEEGEGSERTQYVREGPIEVLPVSRRVWTDAGLAASWRKSGA